MMSLHIYVIIQHVIYEWGGRESLGRCDFTTYIQKIKVSWIMTVEAKKV